MTKRETLTRSCIVCGIEKPLSAFLQINGKQGTSYGSICFSCRSAGKTEKPKSPHEEDRGSTSSEMRIGAKQRLEIEQKQKLDAKEKEQKRKDFLKKHEQMSIDAFERLDEKEKAEKDHRETYIEERKKQAQPKKLPQSIKTLLGQTRNEQTLENVAVTEDKIKFEETNKKEELIKAPNAQELARSPILYNTLTRDNQVFKNFIALLPADAALAKAYSYLLTPQAKQGQPGNKAENTQKETPQEFMEKTWGRGPSSRK